MYLEVIGNDAHDKMKLFISIILSFFIWGLSFGQTTVHGYCTSYKSADSTIEMNRYFSTEVFDDNGKSVYEKIFPLGNPDSMYNISYHISNSNDYVRENVIGLDTARYFYTHDTLNRRSYIITGEDTSMIFETTYENGLMVKSRCIFGCEYNEIINYNSFGSEDTILTIWENGDTSYAIRVYDDKNRQILFKNFLSSPDETPSSQFRSIYNDQLNTRTDIYETPGWKEDGSTEITYLDKDNIPIKKEIIILNGGKKEHWLIIYQKE